jgi:hypothetical protein
VGNDGKTNENSLTVRSSQEQTARASLVKRGLYGLTQVIDATAIMWGNATIRGICYKARKHYGPREFPGTRCFFFVCRIENTTDSRHAPGVLQIYLRSNSGIVTAAPDATLVMLYRNEKQYRSIDLGPKDWTLARLDFTRTFPISRSTKDCQEELLGNTVEIIARDAEGRITVVLKIS